MTRAERAAGPQSGGATLVFIVPRLARGGTLSVMRAAWEHLPDRRIVVIAQEHSTERVPHETVLLPRAFGDPLRFPGAWIYAWRVARAAAGIARATRGEVILVPQDALATGAGAVLAARRTGAPVVLMDHGSAIVVRTSFFWRERMSRSRLDERLREPLLRASLALLRRIAVRGASRVLLPSSEAVDRFIADGVPQSRIARYHVPIDLDRFRPPDTARRRAVRARLHVPGGRALVMAISRLTPEKGLDVLMDAVARMPAERRPILAIGGTGPVRAAIEARARGAGVDLRMLGEVAADELADLLGAADVVAHASRQGTNVPVAILEAMACARLVVATDQPPAASELLGDGRGLVVAAGDPERYAAALDVAVAMSDDARDAAGMAAREWVEREHAPDRVAAELIGALHVGPAR